MSDETERTGLGKLIYSVHEKTSKPAEDEQREEDADVEEADIESFPASDPPGFTGGSATERS